LPADGASPGGHLAPASGEIRGWRFVLHRSAHLAHSLRERPKTHGCSTYIYLFRIGDWRVDVDLPIIVPIELRAIDLLPPLVHADAIFEHRDPPALGIASLSRGLQERHGGPLERGVANRVLSDAPRGRRSVFAYDSPASRAPR
jgi:hypothetical protein